MKFLLNVFVWFRKPLLPFPYYIDTLLAVGKLIYVLLFASMPSPESLAIPISDLFLLEYSPYLHHLYLAAIPRSEL